MGILKFLKTFYVTIVVVFFISCHDYSKEVEIGNSVMIYEWNPNDLPEKATLIKYKKDSGFENSAGEYKNSSITIADDTLNNRKFLRIDFRVPDRLTTGFDYKLVVDDTIECKIHDFTVLPKNQGGEISAKSGMDVIAADHKGIYLYKKHTMVLLKK